MLGHQATCPRWAWSWGEPGLAQFLPGDAVLDGRQAVGGDVLQDGGNLVGLLAFAGGVRALSPKIGDQQIRAIEL
ncbi:hypothetical protein C4B68_00110 [Streptomyces dengpaensis]|uniref:Uncharacterized protein n=1 Tax=Streptomyces dengpaensis TaxID=2049881 RepID=A0ABN5HTP8_9ACTN|nr:hypothetical protein C4B68_00110 [Streptomyces dengpaensis]PIA92504.1 hypothetical protein B1C81_40040 [Streptomyces sp. HG99]